MKRHSKQQPMYTLFIVILFAFMVVTVTPITAAEKKAEDTQKCCPVCKKELTTTPTQFKSEYKGKTIYFETQKCKTEFDKDPEKYMKNCEAAAVSYACPMKVCDYKTDKPGKCPKCGMDLKKVEAKASCCQH